MWPAADASSVGASEPNASTDHWQLKSPPPPMSEWKSKCLADVTIGSFNFGIDQSMLQKNAFKRKHAGNFRRIVEKMHREGDLDILVGCEVGGHKKGMRTQGIDIKDVLGHVFDNGAHCQTVQNYACLWNLNCLLYTSDAADE